MILLRLKDFWSLSFAESLCLHYKPRTSLTYSEGAFVDGEGLPDLT